MDNRNGDLKDRTYRYALQITEFCKNNLKTNEIDQHIWRRLMEHATEIGLITRLAFKSRNSGDFQTKLKNIIQNADTCIYWLELLYDLDQIAEEDFNEFSSEASELIAIFISISKKTKSSY